MGGLSCQEVNRQSHRNQNSRFRLCTSASFLCSSIWLGQSDSVSLYEVSSTTGCTSSSGPGVNLDRIHTTTGYAVAVGGNVIAGRRLVGQESVDCSHSPASICIIFFGQTKAVTGKREEQTRNCKRNSTEIKYGK
ncbi:uncharacterized protein LOC124202848 [Daphnia pulex]|uniref:uncharacterized protein LOC124202848 n=1 Tax=Daphnia pulex TaxID=6669 RepID=UPI001EDD7697|nr:uncharacterized protein LOC124202848 [Daphnia pulex]